MSLNIMMPADLDLAVAIQAGGESRRMGRSKATVPFLGRPLICRLVERVDPVADTILITTNEPQNLSFLDDMPQADKIMLVRDVMDIRGSLRGLLTALTALDNEFVAVCACDMMDVSANLFAAEAIECRDGGYDVVIPVNDQGFEPFHAVWRRESCLEVVRRNLEEGMTSMKSVVLCPALKVRQYSMDEVIAAEPKGGCFANCNTPDELAAAEARILARETEGADC